MLTNKTRWIVIAATLGAAMLMALPAGAHERRIVVEGFEGHRNTMSLQLHGGGLSVSDDTLDVDGVARLGGMSLSFRWDLVRWGGLEFMMGGYGRASEGGLVDESKGLFSAAFLWYFARHHHHRFYAVTGIAGMGTNTQIGDTSVDYSEGGLLLGIGSEWMVSRHFVVSFDVRSMFLSSDSEEPVLITGPAERADGTPYPDRWFEIPEERLGLAFNVGMGYRF